MPTLKSTSIILGDCNPLIRLPDCLYDTGINKVLSLNKPESVTLYKVVEIRPDRISDTGTSNHIFIERVIVVEQI